MAFFDEHWEFKTHFQPSESVTRVCLVKCNYSVNSTSIYGVAGTFAINFLRKINFSTRFFLLAGC